MAWTTKRRWGSPTYVARKRRSGVFCPVSASSWSWCFSLSFPVWFQHFTPCCLFPCLQWCILYPKTWLWFRLSWIPVVPVFSIVVYVTAPFPWIPCSVFWSCHPFHPLPPRMIIFQYSDPTPVYLTSVDWMRFLVNHFEGWNPLLNECYIWKVTVNWPNHHKVLFLQEFHLGALLNPWSWLLSTWHCDHGKEAQELTLPKNLSQKWTFHHLLSSEWCHQCFSFLSDELFITCFPDLICSFDFVSRFDYILKPFWVVLHIFYPVVLVFCHHAWCSRNSWSLIGCDRNATIQWSFCSCAQKRKWMLRARARRLQCAWPEVFRCAEAEVISTHFQRMCLDNPPKMTLRVSHDANKTTSCSTCTLRWLSREPFGERGPWVVPFHQPGLPGCRQYGWQRGNAPCGRM